MKKLIFSMLLLVSVLYTGAQNIYMTKTGKVSFYSRAKSPEKVEAENNEVSSILNAQTGEMVFAILLKSFHFERALMEEHFNENYVESNKYPKSTFKGKVTNLSSINFSKDGTYTVIVEGEFTLHGVSKKVTYPGTFIVRSGKINGSSKLSVKLKDYNINIPSLVADKISEDIDITISCQYELKN